MVTCVVWVLLSIGAFILLSGKVICKEFCFNKCQKLDKNCSYNNYNEITGNVIYPDCRVNSSENAECTDMEFFKSPENNKLSRVKLKAFVDISCRNINIPAFNITLTGIEGTYFRYRFSQMNNKKVPNFCEELHLSSARQMSLIRDCFWIDNRYEIQYEDKSYYFEYEVGDASSSLEGGKYMLTVPKATFIMDYKEKKTTLREWKVFLYVDVTYASSHVTLRWQPPPYQVEGYIVKRYVGTWSESLSWPQDQFEKSGENELSFTFNEIVHGKNWFSVQIKDEACGPDGCAESKSPAIEFEEPPTKYYIAALSTVIVLLFLLYMSYYIAKLQLKFGEPVVLIIYKPSLKSHVRAAVALAKHLRSSCRVQALLDELDIPLSNEKDPFRWCEDAFARAEGVMVLSSPTSSSPEEGIYRKLDDVGLQFLKMNFTNSECRHKKFFSVLLPYCKEEDLPVKNLKCFKLIDNWNEMLWYIHHGTQFSCFSKLRYSVFKSKIPGGKSDLVNNGKELLVALDEAKKEMQVSSQIPSKLMSPNDINKDPEMTNIDLLKVIPVTSYPVMGRKAPVGLFESQNLNSGLSDCVKDFPGDVNMLNLSGVDDDVDSLTDQQDEELQHLNSSLKGGEFDIHSIAR